ncbi:MAG: type VI secretion system contractile sheath large subunit [Rhodospirillales bacterium]
MAAEVLEAAWGLDAAPDDRRDDTGSVRPAGGTGAPRAPDTALLRRADLAMALIDSLLTEQVNAILHHPRFRRLEATWRGIAYLARIADENDRLKVKVLSISWPEICRDHERSLEFDQSQLFSKIYSEEFGMPGGQPYGLLVGDYEITHRRGAGGNNTDDIAALQAVSQVAAAAFSPFVVGASPSLFGLDSFTTLELPIDLDGIFQQQEYVRWRSFRGREDARFVGVVLPRVLMRLPYRDDGSRHDGFRFAEDCSADDLTGYVWGSAAYAFAGTVMRAFAAAGWFVDIRGARRDRDGAGLVTDLPAYGFETERREVVARHATDVALSERQEKALGDLGFIPLAAARDTPWSVFYSNQSVQLPKTFDRAAGTQNARLSTMMQYMLCIARFAHFIKVIARDRVGSFQSPDECQSQINNWLLGYCNSSMNASAEMLARFPLRAASVRVREPPDRPGAYQCVIHLQPHFQLDELQSEFQLATELAGRPQN